MVLQEQDPEDFSVLRSVCTGCFPMHVALSVDTCYFLLLRVGRCLWQMRSTKLCPAFTPLTPWHPSPTLRGWRPWNINARHVQKVIRHTGHVKQLRASWHSTTECGFQGTFPVFCSLLSNFTNPACSLWDIFTIRKLLNLISSPVFNNLSDSFKCHQEMFKAVR